MVTYAGGAVIVVVKKSVFTTDAVSLTAPSLLAITTRLCVWDEFAAPGSMFPAAGRCRPSERCSPDVSSDCVGAKFRADASPIDSRYRSTCVWNTDRSPAVCEERRCDQLNQTSCNDQSTLCWFDEGAYGRKCRHKECNHLNSSAECELDSNCFWDPYPYRRQCRLRTPDCIITPFFPWSNCTASCGEAIRYRYRKIAQLPDPSDENAVSCKDFLRFRFPFIDGEMFQVVNCHDSVVPWDMNCASHCARYSTASHCVADHSCSWQLNHAGNASCIVNDASCRIWRQPTTELSNQTGTSCVISSYEHASESLRNCGSVFFPAHEQDSNSHHPCEPPGLFPSQPAIFDHRLRIKLIQFNISNPEMTTEKFDVLIQRPLATPTTTSSSVQTTIFTTSCTTDENININNNNGNAAADQDESFLESTGDRVLVGVGGGTLFVILLVLFVAFVVRRRNSNKARRANDDEDGEADENQNTLTMRLMNEATKAQSEILLGANDHGDRTAERRNKKITDNDDDNKPNAKTTHELLLDHGLAVKVDDENDDDAEVTGDEQTINPLPQAEQQRPKYVKDEDL